MSVSKKSFCIWSENMSVTALVPFLVKLPWLQSLYGCKWELLCRKADLEAAQWYHFASPVTWCPRGDGTQQWTLWHSFKQQASSWRSYLGFEQTQVLFIFTHIHSRSMLKWAWLETKLVLLKGYLFSKCQLWKVLLDSSIELEVTSDSDYNQIILVYKVTRYTHICNIYIFINFRQKFWNIVWASFIF